MSFNPSDPSWSQTAWHEPIHNLGGAPGAWLADTTVLYFWRNGLRLSLSLLSAGAGLRGVISLRMITSTILLCRYALSACWR
ncbi:hypothetical protein LFZ31_10010 [Salmonella enterica subsp. enterica serovar Newport str. S09097]|nr:hypothetical protein LFZ31_10010 [Salmonella enterica subsp. enterica serovar Newport str. S09097]